MATSRKKRVVQKQYKGSVSYRLTASDKKTIALRATKIDFVTLLEKWVEDDWRPAFKQDYDNSCYRLDMYRAFTGHPDSGYTYTARHTAIDTLCEIADFVIYTVFDGKLPVGSKDEFSW